jgi:hypothetical protein
MMLTSTIYLMYNTLMIPMTDIKFGVLSMITIAVTFSVLRFTKVSPHILVIGFIILGLLL